MVEQRFLTIDFDDGITNLFFHEVSEVQIFVQDIR